MARKAKKRSSSRSRQLSMFGDHDKGTAYGGERIRDSSDPRGASYGGASKKRKSPSGKKRKSYSRKSSAKKTKAGGKRKRSSSTSAVRTYTSKDGTRYELRRLS